MKENYTDRFTDRFIDDPEAFALMHSQLSGIGFLFHFCEPELNYLEHAALTQERYQALFNKHRPAERNDVRPISTSLVGGTRGRAPFFVIYDNSRITDEEHLEMHLRRLRLSI